MGVRSLFQREPGVDPGCQLSAGSCRERLFGVVALLGTRLADDHAQRPAQR